MKDAKTALVAAKANAKTARVSSEAKPMRPRRLPKCVPTAPKTPMMRPRRQGALRHLQR